MRYLLLLFICQVSFAASPEQWTAALEIVDRHEFYKDDEPIDKPKGSWELLFSVKYPSRDLRMIKDCVFYRVPGLERAELRLRTLPASTACDLNAPSIQETAVSELESVIFSANTSEAKLHLRFSKTKSETWSVELPAHGQAQAPGLLDSSSGVRSASVVLLSKLRDDSKALILKDGEACFKVSELCQPTSASQCHLCATGWYEIPTGCKSGPKYCGSIDCGTKNQPACLRGKKYQRKNAEYECRRDSSFAYCQKGLTIQCEGNLAFCR